MKKLIWNAIKVAGAGATIWAIAISVGVIGPEGEVAESEADIISLDFADESPTRKFHNALDDLGHTDPQVYGLNGNVVFFSENRMRREPAQIMEDYQRRFVEQGINSKIYYSPDMEAQTAYLRGEIVPMKVSDGHVILSGLVPTMDFANDDSNVEAIGSEEFALEQMFAGYRSIDISKERNDHSIITASYSDETFDYAKMFNRGDGDKDVDTEVPTCPSCSRVTRFTDPKANFAQNVFSGTHSKRETEKFYIDAMARRGWELTDTSRAYRDLKKVAHFKYKDAAALQFTRGTEFLNVLITDGDSGTTVYTTKSK